MNNPFKGMFDTKSAPGAAPRLHTRISVFVARFGALALRVIISTLVIVLFAGGAWMLSPAPVAFGSEKGHTVEIAKNADMRIVFNQRMDHGSVEQAFTLNPPVLGSFTWNDNVLTFKPTSLLEKGVKYEAVVGVSAQNFVGKNLIVPFRQWFQVTDAPDVSVVAPSNGSEVGTSQRLTVIFDHPIRNLSGSLKVPEILSIQPETKGRYAWLGTAGFEFIPTSGWKPATDFTVTVPSGFVFADGSTLENDYVWSFRTPDLVASLTGNVAHHLTKEPIRISFNAPVKADEVAKSVVIKENGYILSHALFIFSPASGMASEVKITPRGVFKLGSSYDIELPQGWTGGVGTRGLSAPIVGSFKMDEAGFTLKSTCPNDGDTKTIWDGASLTFNNPVDAKNAQGLISVSPAITDMNIDAYGYSSCGGSFDDDGQKLTISGNWKASTKYTVTLKPGLKDIYGQVLSGAKTFSFTTKQHEPSLELNSYSDSGVLAAHLPRVYQARIRNFTQPLSVKLQDERGNDIARREYDTTANLNLFRVIDVDLDELAGRKLGNGYYTVTFNAPDLPNEWSRTTVRNIMIADTSITTKYDNAGKFLAWATDMQTGNVVPNLDVEVNGVKGKTNDQGIAELTLKKETLSSGGRWELRATGGGHFGVTRAEWMDGISSWNYNLQPSYGNHLSGYVGTIYTDRKIYRPDQKVMFKGIVRQDYDAKYAIPAFRDLDVMIENPEGQRVYDGKLAMSRYGSFQGELQLEQSMKLGEYRVYVSPGGDSWENRITGTFTVAEFRRPDFKVTVETPEAGVVQGAQLLVNMHAEYYTGAPLGGGKVSYSVTRRRMDFQPLSGEWFNFTNDENTDCYWYCQTEGDYENVVSGTKDLNIDGTYAISIPTSLGNFKGSANYNIEVTVEDVNHRTVSNRAEVPVFRGDFALGVRANYDSGWDSPSANFDVVTLNNDGSVHGSVSGSAKFYRRVWTNARKENVDGSTFWESTPTDTLMTTSYFTTDSAGRTAVGFTPDTDGEYYVVVEAGDTRGNILAARASRYIYRGGVSSMRVTDDHMLKITQNKADYNVGDTASLAVQTPYEHTKALMTVERETIREYHVIDLGTANHTVTLPISEADVPNIYVSILTAKGGDAGIPEFRMGYADLRVDTTNKVLDINLKTDKKEYKPGDTVTLSIDAMRRGGGPEQAELSVAVVDERIVSLLGSVNKNILGAFWFRRNIGVTTSQTLTALVKKIFVATGEGGGDGKGGDSAVPVRGNFQDTAYWKADIETDSSGHATVSFKLPDNLTNWQILAIGATKNTVVGSAETSISTRRALTVEPLLPRFVRYGDSVKLGASVENGTGIAKSVQVTIKADGLTVTDGVTRNVYVAPKTRVGVTWNVKVPYNVNEADITVTGVATDASDGYNMKLPVLPYSVAEMVTASNILEKSATETVEIPNNILTNQGDIRVAVSPNVGQGLASGVEYLLKYEYGCAEQTASAVLAGTMYEQLASLKFTKASDAQKADAKAKVNAGIQKLLAMQRPNGGFGFWQDSNQTYPYLTSYALWSLYQAQKAGFTVDKGALDRAGEYLMGYLASPSSYEYSWLGPNEKAQVIFVLSELGKSKLGGYADGLYEQKSSLSVFGKGFLAMTYGNLEGRSTSKTGTLLKEIENNIVYLDPTAAYVHEGDGYGYFMSTDLRSSAITLMTYLRIDPSNANTERLVRWLMRQKSGGYWETTQNTSFALLSLIEYAKKNPIDTAKVDVTVFLDSQISKVLTLPEGDVSSEVAATYRIGDLLAKGNTHQFGIEKDTSKKYFYDVTMKVYRQIENIMPFENGFTTISNYYVADDYDYLRPIHEAKQGDVIRVRMQVVVPKRRQYVAFEHHLPAGLEPIDFQLRTSNQSLNQDGGSNGCVTDLSGYQECVNPGAWDYRWWWENVWKHTELRDDRAFLFAEDVEPGIYEYTFFAQAVTQGEFRVPPTRAYEFYTPSSNGHNEGNIFRVK